MSQPSDRPTSRRPRWWILVALLAACVVCCGGGLGGRWLVRRLTQPSIEDIQNYIHDELTASGHMGYTHVGEWEGRVPVYRHGSLMVYAPQAGFPGKKMEPAFLLLMRLNRRVGWYLGSGLSCDGESLEISPVQRDRHGNDFRFLYLVKGSPPVETMTAGGAAYQPENGRVFLVDLTADPPHLVQLNHDLSALLPRSGEELTEGELKSAVERLKSRDPAASDFVDAIEKK